jgi:hypothetical protein
MKNVFSFLLLLAMTGRVCADITTGLLLDLAFDENTGTTAANTGSLGSGANGTLTAGATWSAPGKLGVSCLSLTAASSQYVAIATQSATTAITHAAWIYKTSSGTMAVMNFGKSLLRVTDTSVQFFPDSDNSPFSTFTSTVPQNTWTHICVTHTGTTDRLYINGVEAASSPQTSRAVATSSSTSAIGRYSDGNTNFWGGKIDEVRVYSRALSGADAADLAASGVAKRSAIYYYYLNSQQ